MGTETAVRHLLRNLCDNSRWIYAVFWKLKHRNHLILTWEDGYCDYSKLKDPVLGSSRTGDKSKMISFGSERYANNTSAICPIELAMTNMSCSHYSLGQGSVGKVAFTGKHCWASADECNSKFLTEYSDEWELQFAAGIKTGLLVPVVPHGVLQLGSLDMIPEDRTMVACIKEAFHSLQNVVPLSKNFPMPPVPDGNALNPSKSQPSMQHDLLASETVQVHGENFRTASPNRQPLYTGQDDRLTLENEFQREIIMESMYENFPIDSREVFLEQIPFVYPDQGVDLPSFTCLEDELDFISPVYTTDQRLLAELTALNSDKESPQENGGLFMHQQVGEEADHGSLEGMFDFPIDSELHELLGAAFFKGTESDIFDTSLLAYNESEYAGATCEQVTTEFVGPYFWESLGWFSEANHLDADAAIDNFCGIESPTNSLGNFEASCLTKIESQGGLSGDDLDPWSEAKPNIIPGEHFTGSQAESPSKCVSDLFNEEQKTKEPMYGQFRMGTGSYNMSRKRGRAGGARKPRPRDRQLIQDRVKELRVLVPDGAKCSIDSLLDRTIKHLTFLRSVSNQAKKLKEYANLKINKVGNDDENPTAPQNHQNRMSWTYEIGSQPSTCPIVVENLYQPGHMLVEMLCKEPGLFLDIAQVIKHSGLIILKGVMENRSDNTWAHFIVEASRGFNRMDILWPLMRLFQWSGS
ncbi:Transcription factor [Acorus gramineus]|uniref:Transcription factor n=1 Tax=Acorus gramineus TaxID=55184 RepID=A0AAV9B527_ACOGR|nr:Transcription factor [Acorus gramineus]